MTDVKPLMSDTDDDNRLIRRFLDGDRRAFDSLVERYQQRVFNVIYHTMGATGEAADLAQEVFVKVYRSLPSYEQRSAFSTWIYRITVNVCLDELRRRKRKGMGRAEEMPGEASWENETSVHGEDAVREYERGEMRTIIRQAIDELPDQQRIVVTLRDINGLSYEEIAKILQCRIGTVKSRLFNGRMKLRELLSNYL